MACKANHTIVTMNCTIESRDIKDNDMSVCVISTDPNINSENITVEITVDVGRKVEGFEMKDKRNTSYFPQGIEKRLSHIINMEITKTSLKTITQNNLKRFLDLIILDLSDNKIEILEANLFEGNKKLKYVKFTNNLITTVNPKLFNGLNSFKTFDLTNNICFSQEIDVKKQLSSTLPKLSFKCWNHIEKDNKIDDVKNLMHSFNSSMIEMKNSFKKFQEWDEKMKDIQKLGETIMEYAINSSLLPKNSTKMYIAQFYPISIEPLTYSDLTIINSCILIITTMLLLCVMCCRPAPKYPEHIKNLLVEAHNYQKKKEATLKAQGGIANIDDQAISVVGSHQMNRFSRSVSTKIQNNGCLNDGVATDWNMALNS